MEYNKYNHSYVYKIICNDTEVTDCYIGSTVSPDKRNYQHKHNCKNYKDAKKHNYKVYRFIREHGGWDNWKLLILEQANLNTLTELCQLEKKHYENEPNPSLNNNHPGLTTNESSRLWAKKNPDYQQQYQELNKEKLTLYGKNYSKNNREKINKRLAVKKTCNCGSVVSHGNMNKHIRTNKHLKYLSGLLIT